MFDLQKKLKENHGSYIFNLADAEDAEYVLHSLGGEELLKKDFPLVYEAFNRSVENALQKNDINFDDKLDAQTTQLNYQKAADGTKFQALISGFLCDTSINIDDLGLKAPRPWQSAFISSSISDSDDPSEPPYAALTVYCKDTNEFCNSVSTNAEIDSSTVAKSNLSVITEVTGLDQDGNIAGGAFSNDYTNHAADGGVRVIDRIVLNDPKYKNDAHNNPIIMLYGREANQNPDYKNADYLNGEYKDNNGGEAGDKDLKTLMPISGQIVFKQGFEFKGLTPPDKAKRKVMYRPTISLNSSQVVKYYQDKWSADPSADPNMDMYNAIKDCFKADTTQKNVCNFDLKINDSVNWFANLKNASQYTTENRVLDYQVKAAFKLNISDGKVTAPVDLSVQYTTNPAVPLYITTDGTGVVYIPPVRVYWGCIAKDSIITAIDGEKQISDIRSGDQVLTADGTYATVAQVLHAEEPSIYRIKTLKGTIGLTGGHPVLLDNGDEKTAASVEKGDKLMMQGGEAAEVIDIYSEQYHDTVYSLFLQESNGGTFIYANGFAVGDTDAQNRPLQSSSICYTERQLSLQEQFHALYQHIHKPE